ncbi:hypothetical protein FCV25MIE_06040 [Fagus crenata]
MEKKASKGSMERKEIPRIRARNVIPRIRARNEGRPMVDASTFYGGLMRQYQDLLRVSVQETKERNNSRSSDASHETSKDVTSNGSSMKGKGIVISSSEALELKKPNTQASNNGDVTSNACDASMKGKETAPYSYIEALKSKKPTTQLPRSRKNFSSSQPSMKGNNDPTRGPQPPPPLSRSSQPSMEGWEPTNDPTRGPQPPFSRSSQPSMEGWEPTNDPTLGPQLLLSQKNSSNSQLSSPNNGC